MPDLHSRIATEIDRRLAVARAATPGPWAWVQMPKFSALQSTTEVEIGGEDVRPFVLPVANPEPADAAHIALNDPEDSIRRLEAASRVLNRHARYVIPEGYGPLTGTLNCPRCNNHAYPCQEIADLAASLGLDTEGSTTDG
jgi:hypothetical protein